MSEIELGPAAEATIQAYKELAVDPAKRLALALDRTCIQFLAYVVAEGKGSVVAAAVDTLALIAQTQDCRPSLANTFGVLEALQSVTENEESYSQELRDQAAGLFTSLQFARHIKNQSLSQKEDKKEDDKPGSPASPPTPANTPTSDHTSFTSLDAVDNKTTESKSGTEMVLPKTKGIRRENMPMKSAVEKRESFLGPHNSRAKIVTLYVKGMVHPEHRKLVEDELVRVRGLISIVFDLGHSRVTCRVKRDLPVEKLAAAVARTETLTALQVTTNAKGEEEMVALDRSPSGRAPPPPSLPSHRSEDDALPDYLPEDDLDPVEDASSAMAPSGTFMQTATSWFSSATNLLQKSFLLVTLC